MGSFITWFCKRIGKKKLSKSNLEGPLFKVAKSFHENSISLQFHMEECYRILTDQVDLVNLEKAITRSHMQILSVTSIKTYERYGYTYLREIVLRKADYNEYKISEADFKNLYPNDFEDLYLLHLQGKLNHLPGSDKVHLYTAINLWIRNIVTRQYALDFLFKEDYTIVNKPRAIIYKDRNDMKKKMRIEEVHKFSDGTLTRILDKLDHMVKHFKLYKYNRGMENRIWSKDDKRRSEEFIEVIERRLKIKRIFRSLESFVGG
ncbi:hypothetical protein Tco_1268759 [Tanacetum coccineum]